MEEFPQQGQLHGPLVSFSCFQISHFFSFLGTELLSRVSSAWWISPWQNHRIEV